MTEQEIAPEQETASAYEVDQEVWIRTVEGSIGQGKVVEDRGAFVTIQLDDSDEKTVADRSQVALTCDGLLAAEPDIGAAEREEIILLATNQFAQRVTETLQRGELYAQGRWGQGSNREGVFKAAMYAACRGVAEGLVAGDAVPTACLAIYDTMAREVATHVMKQRDEAKRSDV